MLTMRTLSLLVIALLLSTAGLSAQPVAKGSSPAPAIVFVCEHGAAKSVIASAYFNKLAAERGLPYRATFRGTSPQEALSVRAVQGLAADGVAIPQGAPTAIGEADIKTATHIFAIGCALPAAAVSSGKAKDWSDVPDDKGYEAQRDAIVRHVRELLDDLQRRSQYVAGSYFRRLGRRLAAATPRGRGGRTLSANER